MSAADMFASNGCKRACSNFQKKPTQHKSASASLISSAIVAGSVILATQLRANAQETKDTLSEVQVSNLSPDVIEGQTLPAPASFNVDNILGSVIEERSSTTEVASLKNLQLAGSGETTAFPSENGLPRGAITESFGVDDPSQITDEVELSLQDVAFISANTPSSSAGGFIAGEDGINGVDGIDGQDGADGHNGIDGENGQTVFVLDPETFQNPAIILVLAQAHIEVTQGPGGLGYVTIDADQLESLIALVNNASTLVEQGPAIISGNDTDDFLVGNAENNIISGFGGDDILIGGGGTDELFGGEGSDLADYSTSAEGVNISLQFDTANEGDAEGDELNSIENLNGSRHFDTLEGDNQDNRLGGLSGDDELFGEGGNDTLLGGSGADVIDGGDGIDTSDYTASTEGVSVNLATGESLFGEAEGDELFSIENLAGSAFNDTLIGDDSSNRLSGRDGDDFLFGGGGNDRFVGGLGADYFDGGSGDRDTIDYSAAEEAIGVDLETRGFLGVANGDTFNSIEFVVGSNHSDIIYGDDAINRLNGGDDIDFLSGRGGNDSLLGGSGDDVLNGGTGDDIFILEANNGFDIIEDFEAGEGRTDRVDLRPLDYALFDDFEDIQAALADTQDGAILALEDGSVLFLNVAANEFVADDFILA